MTTSTVPVFDGHNDTLLRLELLERNGRARSFFDANEGGHIDLPRARQGGFAGGLFAMFTPARFDVVESTYPHAPDTHRPVDQATALDFTVRLMARARRIAAASDGEITIATDTDGIRAAMDSGRMAIVHHIEGAECIDTDFTALEVLYAAGLRSLGPVWSRANAFGDGAPMAASQEVFAGNGLTEAGIALIHACEQLGIALDLSHMTQKGFWDAARVATKPLIASHSNVHALSPSSRNLNNEQLRAIGESGGLVGVNFHVAFLREDCGFGTDVPLDVMLRHFDHLIAILGEDGVAFGSDFDGCRVPAEIKDAAGLPGLIARMREAGYGDGLIAKIAHRNWLRVLERHWA